MISNKNSNDNLWLFLLNIISEIFNIFNLFLFNLLSSIRNLEDNVLFWQFLRALLMLLDLIFMYSISLLRDRSRDSEWGYKY